MTDDRTLQMIDRGEKAKVLLENVAVKGAFEGLGRYADSLVRGAATPDEAFRAVTFTQVLGQVRDALTVAVAHGVSASEAILAEQEQKRRASVYETNVRERLERGRIAREKFDESERERTARKQEAQEAVS